MGSQAFHQWLRLSFRSHPGLRHTHISHLLMDGVHVKVVSERAGHAAVSVTLDRYSHVIPNMQEDAAIIVDEGLREALQP